MGLSNAEIQALYAKKRTKGLYEDCMTELLEGDEPGVNPAETWPLHFGTITVVETNEDGTPKLDENGEKVTKKEPKKSATTIYQGFNNAVKKLNLTNDIDVIQRDGAVFIMVKTRVTPILQEQMEEDGDETLVTTMNGSEPVATPDTEDEES